ncbi:Ribonuclease HI [Buchnera aphidicola (Protaphis terricola)]|uniref:ribonuclease HI n=1 Tax=Buchnera aphidicola TaxID=9 RepID=UPI003463C4D0
MLKLVKIFTDGSCLGNPGSGGYATILRYKKKEKILSSSFFLTTNNRMELMGVISGLESLKIPCFVEIYTDSRYVKIGVTNWIFIWRKKKWKKFNKKSIKNIDLWRRMNNLINKHFIKWIWIKAHIGHIENEKCDQIARKCAKSPSLRDIFYEKIFYNQKMVKL